MELVCGASTRVSRQATSPFPDMHHEAPFIQKAP